MSAWMTGEGGLASARCHESWHGFRGALFRTGSSAVMDAAWTRDGPFNVSIEMGIQSVGM